MVGALVARRNKLKFNELGAEIQKYDTNEVYESKLEELKGEIRVMEQKFRDRMKRYETRLRLFRHSVRQY